MKNLILAVTLTILGSLAFADEAAPGVSRAKVAELSAHRIDRLVSLSKIAPSFLTHLNQLTVSEPQNQAPTYYAVLATQTSPQQGNPLQLDLAFDTNGKSLSFKVNDGKEGTNPGWTEKDSVSLMENALHYVLENTANAKVALFDKGLTVITLTKGTLNNQIVARGQMSSSLTNEKLNVYLKLDGTFISAEFVQ